MRRTRCALMAAASLLLGLAVFSACGGKDDAQQNETESPALYAAKLRGRVAAKQIVNREWTDTLKLMNALLHARALQSVYIENHKDAEAAAFDEAFMGEIRAVNPQLAKTIMEGVAK